MASAPDRSVTESIRDDFLTCHICFEVFTDPRILPCLHTYCFQCVCSHADAAQAEGRSVVCPECREPISDSVSCLKSNFFINGLTEIIKEKSVESVFCTACNLRGIESKANVKCLDCGDYLCSICANGHNDSSLTWKHEKIALDDIKQGTYDEKLRQMQKIKCPKHEDKHVEFYCEACSRSVCLTCVVLDHRDHKCITISDAVCDKRSKIKSLTEELKRNRAIFTSKENDILFNLKELGQRNTKDRHGIEKRTQQDIEKIKARQSEEFQNLMRRTNTTKKGYEDLLDDLKTQKSLMNSCISFTESILKKGKDEEVVMLEVMMTERLIQLQNLDNTTGMRRSSSQDAQATSTCADTSEKETDVASEEATSDIISFSKTQKLHYTPRQVRAPATLGLKPDECQQQQRRTLSSAVHEETRRLVLQDTLSVQCVKDQSKPDIRGMVYSSAFGLLVADTNNCNIKIISKGGKLLREISTTDFQPSAVAVAGDVIGAISDNFLLLFSSEGSLSRKIKITERKQYPNNTFLAASKSLGFVVYIQQEDRLCFYNLEGKFARYLYCSIKPPLGGLSVTPFKTILLSERELGRIKVIDGGGRPRFTSGDSEWKPDGTCMSGHGDIYFADFAKGIISGLSPKGIAFLDHSTHLDGIYNPTYVVADDNDMIYVSDTTGIICVYKLK